MYIAGSEFLAVSNLQFDGMRVGITCLCKMFARMSIVSKLLITMISHLLHITRSYKRLNNRWKSTGLKAFGEWSVEKKRTCSGIRGSTYSKTRNSIRLLAVASSWRRPVAVGQDKDKFCTIERHVFPAQLPGNAGRQLPHSRHFFSLSLISHWIGFFSHSSEAVSRSCDLPKGLTERSNSHGDSSDRREGKNRGAYWRSDFVHVE